MQLINLGTAKRQTSGIKQYSPEWEDLEHKLQYLFLLLCAHAAQWHIWHNYLYVNSQEIVLKRIKHLLFLRFEQFCAVRRHSMSRAFDECAYTVPHMYKKGSSAHNSYTIRPDTSWRQQRRLPLCPLVIAYIKCHCLGALEMLQQKFTTSSKGALYQGEKCLGAPSLSKKKQTGLSIHIPDI